MKVQALPSTVKMKKTMTTRQPEKEIPICPEIRLFVDWNQEKERWKAKNATQGNLEEIHTHCHHDDDSGLTVQDLVGIARQVISLFFFAWIK